MNTSLDEQPIQTLGKPMGDETSLATQERVVDFGHPFSNVCSYIQGEAAFS